MKEEREQDQRIEDFVLGRLHKDDAQRMAADPLWREDIRLQSELFAAVDPNSAVNRLRRQVGMVMRRRRGRRRQLWLGLAASLALLLTYLLWPTPPSTSVDTLLAQHFPSPLLTQTARNLPPTDAADWTTLVRHGQYREALTTLQQHAATDPNSTYQLQLAELSLLTHQPQACLQALDRVAAGFPRDKAWYAAWALLLSGQDQAAQTAFQTISETPGPYQDAAREVMANWPAKLH
ncbi:MAG: hypothetical protein KDC54_08095 [Lewinella sp.]|nr:hypothetical protein [Lewinella sp.]